MINVGTLYIYNERVILVSAGLHNSISPEKPWIKFSCCSIYLNYIIVTTVYKVYYTWSQFLSCSLC